MLVVGVSTVCIALSTRSTIRLSTSRMRKALAKVTVPGKPGMLGRDRQLEKYTHTVQSMLSTRYNTAGIDCPGMDLRWSPVDLDSPRRDFSSSISSSIDGNSINIEPFRCSAICLSRPRHRITFEGSSTEASFLGRKSPRSTFQCCTG